MEFPEDDARRLELELCFILMELIHRRGIDATWSLLDRLMPKKATGRPRDPDGQIARRLHLSYALCEATRRATGKQLSLTAAAKQVDREHNPRATSNTWQSILREHNRTLQFQRRAIAIGAAMQASKPGPQLDDGIFFGLTSSAEEEEED
jgi:hypothetical protein